MIIGSTGWLTAVSVRRPSGVERLVDPIIPVTVHEALWVADCGVGLLLPRGMNDQRHSRQRRGPHRRQVSVQPTRENVDASPMTPSMSSTVGLTPRMTARRPP